MRKLKITFNAPVVLTFVVICFIATILGIITQGRSTQAVFMTYHSSLKNPMRIIIVIAITALATGFINYIFFGNVALCGASGVVFAFIVLASFTGFKAGEIPLTFILVVIIFIGQQVYEGIAIQDNISNMAHIVGGIIGACVGYGLNKEKRVE